MVNILAKQQTKSAVTRVEVDKTSQTVKAFGKSGELIAFFPATVGSEEKPTPSGVLKVTSIDARPYYGYNPDYKFKGVKSKEAFTINPGPNNPAGSYWIGLSAEGSAFMERRTRRKSASRSCMDACGSPIGMSKSWQRA